MTAARIGLTGGIGSGKSAVGKLFCELGVTVIDSDMVARKVTVTGSPALKKIFQRFGEQVIDQHGGLDRKALGAIVFSDADSKAWLEQLLHPLIREETDSLAEISGSPYCILEIPLLIETGRDRDMDAVIVVSCPMEIRKQRVLRSRKLTETTFKQIVDSQVTDEQRQDAADYLIDNSGTPEQLSKKVRDVYDLLQDRFTNAD